MNAPEILEILRNLGSEPFTSSPEELAALLKIERERWARIVNKAGIRLE